MPSETLLPLQDLPTPAEFEEYLGDAINVLPMATARSSKNQFAIDELVSAIEEVNEETFAKTLSLRLTRSTTKPEMTG